MDGAQITAKIHTVVTLALQREIRVPHKVTYLITKSTNSINQNLQQNQLKLPGKLDYLAIG